MLTARAIYNYDTQKLPSLLESYVQKNENIKAFEIIEKIENKPIIRFYRDKDKIVFNQKIAIKVDKLNKFETIIKYNNENIAKIILYTQSKFGISLTKEEKEWIKTHIVKIGVEQWAPAVFSNDGTDIDGITGDFLKKIIKATGLKVKIVNDGWINLLPAFKEKKIDLLPATYYTQERTAYGLYSDEYFKVKNCIYIKKTNYSIKSFKDLFGKRLALEKGNANIDKVSQKFPKINIVITKDFGEAINKVLSGEVDATYDAQTTIEYRIKNEVIEGLKGIPQKSFKAPAVRFFSKIDEPILHSILQKGLKNISHLERYEIISKWINLEKKIKFTNKELEWIDKEQSIKYVFDPDWRPLEWSNELNEHTGIISDLIKLIEQKSGIEFKEISSQTWHEAVQKAEDKEVNMYSGVGETNKRKKYMYFTKNKFLTTSYVFVSRLKEDYIDGFEATIDKKIAVVSNSTIEGIMNEKKPNINLTLIKSIQDGFIKLEDKDIDILIVNAQTAKYFINTLGYDDLKIAYKTKFNLNLKIAISKDLPKEVLSILDKTIEAISKKEMSDIIYKWTNIKVKKVTNWKLIGQISIFILFIIMFLIWNNRKLNQMVKEKTADILSKNRELEKLSNSLEEKVKLRTADLEKSQKNIKDSINYALHIQRAILPNKDILQNYFNDSFVLWKPKDTIGGDIYFISELKSKEEIIIMVLDGAGHGVPGAFLTMLVKAIETQIISDVNSGKLPPSPAKILEQFNRNIKTVIKQEKGSKSNIGFDGGILYYNKKTKVCKYAGAKTPLYLIEDKIKTLKSDRKSVGYIRTKATQTYKEYDIKIEKNTKIYIATDGIIDQNNKNELRYGKVKFQDTILKYNHLLFSEQKYKIENDFIEFKQLVKQRDDITVVGIKFN